MDGRGNSGKMEEETAGGWKRKQWEDSRGYIGKMEEETRVDGEGNTGKIEEETLGRWKKKLGCVEKETVGR